MKTTSILALATAIALCSPSFVLAQAATTATDAAANAAGTVDGAMTSGDSGASGAAGGTVNADANNDGTVSADEQSAADAASSASVSVSVDANADGTISADEIAAANTTISGSTGTTVNIDTDGDGTISADELTAANSQLNSAGMMGQDLACAENGIEATIAAMGAVDMGALGTATKISIVTVSDCEAADVTSALASEGASSVRKALEANATAVAAIQARGASVADVLGATGSGDSLTVYVANVQG